MTEPSKEQEIYEKLKTEVESASWEPLKEHYQRGAIIVVSNDLDLIQVGSDIATDNVEIIKNLLSDGKLTQPTDEHAQQFTEDEDVMFHFIIVQPYVLIQKKVDD